MSVYIPGMEMPTDCENCIFCDGDACLMHKPDEYRSWPEEYKNCPLVPVPEHGRLIDLDAIPKEAWRGEKEDLVDELILAPTIIPASGGSENE